MVKQIKFSSLNYSECLYHMQKFILDKGFSISIVDVYVSTKHEVVSVNLKFVEVLENE